MWRWSFTAQLQLNDERVFSTYVEVILIDGSAGSATYGVLHVCGGDPLKMLQRWSVLQCSPRMWRWSQLCRLIRCISSVFSTYVEVILKKHVDIVAISRVLHVCGGDPEWTLYSLNKFECSPRMWRWSPTIPDGAIAIIVFSTYVEVILNFVWGYSFIFGVLHVCGGDPLLAWLYKASDACSPRMWRWSRAKSSQRR